MPPSKQVAEERYFKFLLESGQGAGERGMPLEQLWTFKEGVRRQGKG